MNNKKNFEQDYNNINARFVKILCEFPSIDPIFKKLQAAIAFSEEKNLKHDELVILIFTILEPNMEKMNNFFNYYNESILLLDKFFVAYDDYRDKNVDGWMATIVIINDCLSFYNSIIANLKF